MTRQYRQGDVLLREISPNSPRMENTLKASRTDGRFVLAYGEATGHAHAIKDEGVQMLTRFGNPTVLVVEKPVEWEHEEHATILVEPGIYEIVMQRQQDPREENKTERRAYYD